MLFDTYKPLSGSFDEMIDVCYHASMLTEEGRPTIFRVVFLDSQSPASPSDYDELPPVTRYLPRAVANGVGRLTGTDWRPLPTDIIMFEHGGLHFEHQFVPGEIEYEVAEAGLHIAAHQVGDDGLILLMVDD